MLFRPTTAHKTWDAWICHDRGRYHLYYLISDQYVCDGVGVATSVDGLTWHDHGWVLRHSDQMVRYFAFGSLWPNRGSLEAKAYIGSYSEWRMEEGTNVQTLYFATSDDLMSWDKLDDSLAFRIDERYYKRIDPNRRGPWEDPRWDGMCVVPAADGGYHGYWTATPRDDLGLGYGTSPDGLHWKAEPPARIDWGDSKRMIFVEVGGVHRIGSRYYAMLADYASTNCGVFGFVSDSPRGPFRPCARNYRLLQNSSRMHAYFSRFVDSPDGLLVTHHSIAEGDFSQEHCVVYYAPMKVATTIEDSLYLTWWSGNDPLKTLPIAMPAGATELRFDSRRPLVLECAGRLGAAITLERERGQATVIVIRDDSVVEIRSVDPSSCDPVCEECVDRQVDFRQPRRIRLLIRSTMLELYINDFLIQCYTMASGVTGRVSWTGMESAEAWHCGYDGAA